MGVNILFPMAQPLLATGREHWQTLAAAKRLIGSMAIIVAARMVHARSVLAGSIERGMSQQAAAGSAASIDRFLGPGVQKRTRQPSLSAKRQEALQRHRSSTPIGKPIVALRNWLGDAIAFHRRPEIIGRQWALKSWRDRAQQGDVAGKIALDGEDDADWRALPVPGLESWRSILRTCQDLQDLEKLRPQCTPPGGTPIVSRAANADLLSTATPAIADPEIAHG